MGKPITPLFQIKLGALITPKFDLKSAAIQHWKYASECADIGGGLIGCTARLVVVEKSPLESRSEIWIKVAIEGMSPPRILKLSGEEYALKFLSAD